jgi:hypothetical protein
MDTKQYLPDELLDIISGGVLTVEGAKVNTVLFNGKKSIVFYTDAGGFEFEFSPEARTAIEADPSIFENIVQDIRDMRDHDAEIRFEDYIAS